MSRPGKGNKAPIFSARPSTGRAAAPPGPWTAASFAPPTPPPQPLGFQHNFASDHRQPRGGRGRRRGSRESWGGWGGGTWDPSRGAPLPPPDPGPAPGAPWPVHPARPGSRGAGCWALPLAPVTKHQNGLRASPRPLPAGLSVSRLASHNKSLARS